MSYDAVNRPSHYAEGRQYEPIAVIEDWELGYHLGNALKYISRAGRKDDITQDLRKAVWYIERHIEALEEKTYTDEQENIHYDTDLYEKLADTENKRKAGFVDIYQEILNMKAEVANTFNLQIPTQDVDDQPLDYWEEVSDNPNLPGYVRFPEWDSDEKWMVDTDEDCGWDPNSGPTC